METKQCSRCGEVKVLEEFHRERKGKYGRNSICKKCRSRAKPKLPVRDGYMRCTVCQGEYPATSEWFKKDKRRENGLASMCKSCATAYTKHYYRSNTDKVREYNKLPYHADRDHRRELSKQWYRNNKQYHREYGKQWKEANKERVQQLQRQYYRDNREQLLERSRHWRQENQERYRAYNQEWEKQNPDKAAIIRKTRDVRRRARKRGLPNSFTPEQWLECLQYWNERCAVCNSDQELHADHWIPLSRDNCPGTVVENMICLCSHCNKTKLARHPVKWLIEKLSEEAAMQKLAEIETYFEYVKNSITRRLSKWPVINTA